ncbi:MAG: hypothetical protein ABIG96_04910 [Candidatus Micrarchaeota archaeon]
MEIPKPRLKGLLELDLEAKNAERAVVAIRRKSLQIDTELEKVRDDVESEMERLDSQRTYLESAMQEILQEQATVVRALSELEARQNSHKRNVQLLKAEEETIDKERREINSALRELRQAQKSLKETVNKKYFQGLAQSNFKTSGMKSFNYDWKPQPSMESRFESDQLSPERDWQEEEAKVKPIHPAMHQRAEQEPSKKEMPPSKMPMRIAAEAIPQQAEEIIAADKPVKKPGILKRLRLATDRFLPQPFRSNKPPIAILEEKVGQADSAEAIETSIERIAEDPAMASAIEMENQPSVTQEIENFEQKLSQYDEVENAEAPIAEAEPEDDVRSRLSSIIRGKKPPSNMPQKPQMPSAEKPILKPANPIAKSQIMEQPKAQERNEIPGPSYSESDIAEEPPAIQKISPQMQKIVKKRAGMNEGAESSIPSGDKSFVVIEHRDDPKKIEQPAAEPEPTFEDAKKEIIKTLSTEAKLQRLHSKLMEMKAALKTISDDREPKKEVKKPEKGIAQKKAEKTKAAKPKKENNKGAMKDMPQPEIKVRNKPVPFTNDSVHKKIEKIRKELPSVKPLFEEEPLHLMKGNSLFDSEEEKPQKMVKLPSAPKKAAKSAAPSKKHGKKR